MHIQSTTINTHSGNKYYQNYFGILRYYQDGKIVPGLEEVIIRNSMIRMLGYPDF